MTTVDRIVVDIGLSVLWAGMGVLFWLITKARRLIRDLNNTTAEMKANNRSAISRLILGSRFYRDAVRQHGRESTEARAASDRILEVVDELWTEGGEHKAEGVKLEWRPIDQQTTAMLGYPIRVRRTAVGKPFRVEQDGRPSDQGFDSWEAAMEECIRRAFEIDGFQGASRE